MKNLFLIIGLLVNVSCGKHFLIETIDGDRDSEGADYMEVKGNGYIIH